MLPTCASRAHHKRKQKQLTATHKRSHLTITDALTFGAKLPCGQASALVGEASGKCEAVLRFNHPAQAHTHTHTHTHNTHMSFV